MKNKLKIIIPIIAAVAAVIIALVCVNFKPQNKADMQSVLQTAQKYLTELNYEQAIAEFKKVLEIEPMNVDAYLGIAEAYERSGDIPSALEWLKKGFELTENSALKAELDRLSSEEEIIRAQALEILSSFIPNKLTGEPNSVLYAYYGEYYDMNGEVSAYMCFKCEYDDNGKLIKENDLRLYNFGLSEFFDEIHWGNIISYTPYSAKTFARLGNGNYAVCTDVACSSGIQNYWIDHISIGKCRKKSDSEYEIDAGHNVFTVYVENDRIYKIENNTVSGESESISYNYEASAWEYLNHYITPYVIGLPEGCDESIFYIDDKIEKTFTDYNEFSDYIRNN